jgi:hypothetical protein
VLTSFLWVVDHGDEAIKVFPYGATGDISPTHVIKGPFTGLSRPWGIAIQQDGLGSGVIYVSNVGTNSITVYNWQDDGDVFPIRTIQGDLTQLATPGRMCVDGSGNLFVINDPSDSSDGRYITVFAPGALDNAAPIRVIRGDQTGIQEAVGVTCERAGGLYVLNGEFGRSLLYFDADANGNVSPSRVVSGAMTGIIDSMGLSSNGLITFVPDHDVPVLCVCDSASGIFLIPLGAEGNVAPIGLVSASNPESLLPFAIYSDEYGNIFVASLIGPPQVAWFYADPQRNGQPVGILAGGNTTFQELTDLAAFMPSPE